MAKKPDRTIQMLMPDGKHKEIKYSVYLATVLKWTAAEIKAEVIKIEKIEG